MFWRKSRQVDESVRIQDGNDTGDLADSPGRNSRAKSSSSARKQKSTAKKNTKSSSRSAKSQNNSQRGGLFSLFSRTAEPENPKSRSRKGKAATPKKRSWTFYLFCKAAYWGSVAAVWGIIIVLGTLAYYAASLPPIHNLTVPKRAPNVVITASNHEPLASRGIGHGADVRIEQLPEHLAQAVMSIEDRRFRSHFGVDIIGLIRASIKNFRSGRIVQGGSTLTQQLAKNLFLKPDRTIKRKMQEVVLAFWLEANYSKDEILETYLNRVYFGAGTYGVEAASRRFFNKSARDLNLSESAVLAGLLKAPSKYAPHRNPDGAESRAYLVLNNMVEEGYISITDGQLAVDNPATLARRTKRTGLNYVADWVADIIPDYIGQPEQDIVVVTTIDQRLQEAAERAVSHVLDEEGTTYKVGQGALVSMAGDGAIKSLIGGKSYADSQFNRAVRARRQPGSAFKPFVFLAALERGMTPATIRRDSPIRIGKWEPKNYSERYRGDMSLRNALAHSVNTIAARLIREVKSIRVIGTAKRLGITSPLHKNASLALGTAEVSPLELTTAYVPFANGGMGVLPYVISEIKTADGEILYQREGSGPGRVVSKKHVGQMNDMMSATIKYGTGRRADFGWPAAGKTGTSQGFRDAWFVGYTTHLTTSVWVGNDDGTPTNRVTGGGLPAMIWHRYMHEAHADKKIVQLPGIKANPTTRTATPSKTATNPLIDTKQAEVVEEVPESEINNSIDKNFLERIFGG